MNSLLDNQRIGKRIHSGAYTGSGVSFQESGERNLFRQVLSRKREPETAFRPSGLVSFLERDARFVAGIQREVSRREVSRRGFSRGSARGSASRARKHDGDSFGDFPSFRNINRGLKQGIRNLARLFDDEDVPADYAAPPEKERVERAAPQPRYGNAGQKSRGQSRKGGALSFDISPVPVVALLLLGLGILFMVLRSGTSLDWLGREVVDTGKDRGSEYHLARYAGIGPLENSAAGENSGETIPLDLTETFAWRSYTARKGDSVSKIAAAFSVSMDAIISSNNITNARALREGEKLRIPNMDGIPYAVKDGDSLAGISKSMGVPLEAILDANDIQTDVINTSMTLFIPGARMKRDELRLALGELFVYPVTAARLTSPFGWRNDPISGVRRHHAALDLAAPQGTPVRAAMDGRVSALGYNNVYGNFIVIDHFGGYQSMYAHLYSTQVKKGAQVAQGAEIGTVGNTGYSTGPHLHFSIFKNDRAVNPLDFLNPRK